MTEATSRSAVHVTPRVIRSLFIALVIGLRRWLGRTIVAIGGSAILGLAVLAAPSAAASHVVAFSDTSPAPTVGIVTVDLQNLKQLYCQVSTERFRSVSLARALSVARRLVAADSHGHGLAAISRSRSGRTERKAIAAAAGALAAGKPAASLAALLRAHRLSPRDPVPLIDMAPLLSQAGRGDEALAALAAASRLRLPNTYPFGVGWRAVIAADRGEALVVLHRYGKAELDLHRALAIAPLLSEANQDLAVAYDCQGNTTQAQRYLVAGASRQQFPPQDYIDTNTEQPWGQLDPAEVLDTHFGQPLTLPSLRLPSSMQEAAAMRRALTDISVQQTSAMTQLASQQSADATLVTSRLAGCIPFATPSCQTNEATAQRTLDIVNATQGAGAEPDIKPLQTQAVALSLQIGSLYAQNEGQVSCADGGAGWGRFSSLLAAYDGAQRAYAAALYRRQTGLAANLKDPAAHRWALDWAQIEAQGNWADLLEGWILVTQYAESCNPSNVTENPESGQVQMPPSPACPSGLVGPDISVSLVVVSFSVTCEEVTLEAEVGEGWLNGFLSGSHNFKKGSNTIYVGAQVGGKIEIGPLSGGASARGGICATFGADGSFQGAGVKGSTSAAITVGSATASVSGPETSIAFVGSLED